MDESFDPYLRWLGIPPEEQPAHHYRLLEIATFEARAEIIAAAADRQMAHVRKMQTSPHGRKTQQILNELSTARICLLDTQRKTQYDAELRAKLAPPAPPTPPVTTMIHATPPVVNENPYASPQTFSPVVEPSTGGGSGTASLVCGIISIPCAVL